MQQQTSNSMVITMLITAAVGCTSPHPTRPDTATGEALAVIAAALNDWQDAVARDPHQAVLAHRGVARLVQRSHAALRSSLVTGSVADQATAALALGFWGDAHDLALLRAALDHPDAAVRSNALTALGLRGKSACSAALLLAGLVDPDATVRSAAAFAIGEVLDAPLAEANETALIGALGDREADVRLHAALALARLGSGLARPALQYAARHDVDAGVRLNAYLALATQGDVDMATDLIAGLDDRDLEVRAVCAASLRVLTGVDHGVDRASWEQWARERRDGGHR